MSNTDLSAAPAPAAPEPASAPANALYFAIWRWHFYAGLYVVPFLLMLAITGFFMMWFTAIAPEYGDRLAVEPAGQALDLADQQAAALAAVPGTLTGYTAPYDAATPALFFVTDAQGAAQVVALDPYRGTAVRVMAEGATWNAFAEEIHGTLMIGDMGDRLIEIAASLGLLLVVSGAYLWWPRGGASVRDLFVPRLAARGRSFWKSLHAVTGAWTAILLAFFFVTRPRLGGHMGREVRAGLVDLSGREMGQCAPVGRHPRQHEPCRKGSAMGAGADANAAIRLAGRRDRPCPGRHS